MTGEELAVKPTRIIAGHEPENTNILLQTVYTFYIIILFFLLFYMFARLATSG